MDIIDAEVVEVVESSDNLEFKPIVKSGVADFNYQELKSQLAVKLLKYQNYVVTSDNLMIAKKDLAFLRKVKEAIDSERKRAKKIVLKPYETEFEPKVKELIGMIEGIENSISNQTRAHEEIEKLDKKRHIQEYFKTLEFDYITFEQIFQDKWLNKTCSMDLVKNEINTIIKEIKDNITVIDSTIGSEVGRTDVKIEYLKTLNLAEALQKWRTREELKKTIQSNASNQVEEDTQKFILKFEVIATKRQISLLSQFLKENQYSYKQIKEEE